MRFRVSLGFGDVFWLGVVIVDVQMWIRMRGSLRSQLIYRSIPDPGHLRDKGTYALAPWPRSGFRANLDP